MNSWFEVKVKYTKQLEDGRLKRVTEPYLVDAISFTDAEARVYEEVGSYVKGEFIIKSIARKEVADIFFYEDCEDWCECRLKYVTVDADSGKEKETANTFLITAPNLKEAYNRIKESLSDMTINFEVTSTKESPIVDVLPYTPEVGQERSRMRAEA